MLNNTIPTPYSVTRLPHKQICSVDVNMLKSQENVHFFYSITALKVYSKTYAVESSRGKATSSKDIVTEIS